jgi:hypothetical protein
LSAAYLTVHFAVVYLIAPFSSYMERGLPAAVCSVAVLQLTGARSFRRNGYARLIDYPRARCSRYADPRREPGNSAILVLGRPPGCVQPMRLAVVCADEAATLRARMAGDPAASSRAAHHVQRCFVATQHHARVPGDGSR